MAVALDDVGKAAWTAELAKQCGKYKMRPVVQAQLVQHFADMGEALAEAGLDVTKEDVEEWETIWKGTLSDAGVTQNRDVAIFLAWGKARCSVAARAGGQTIQTGPAADDDVPSQDNDPAARALRLLEGSGIVIPEDVRAKLVKDFKEIEAGTYSIQCCNAVTVFIIYLGRMPTGEEIKWWNRDYKLAGGANGGKIDITRSEGYVKMHNKTAAGDVLTLARALKQEERFSSWVVTTMEALSKAGMPLACVQLTKVLLQADKNAVGVWSVKAAYLHGYFFEEYLGIGLPQVTALNSALHAVASAGPRGGKEKATPEVVQLGSRSDPFGSLPGSASQVGASDVGSALSAIKEMMEDALAPIKELKEAKPGGKKVGGGPMNEDGECPWCGRSWCTMLKGGEMCRSATRSLALLRNKKGKNKDDGEESSKEA